MLFVAASDGVAPYHSCLRAVLYSNSCLEGKVGRYVISQMAGKQCLPLPS